MWFAVERTLKRACHFPLPLITPAAAVVSSQWRSREGSSAWNLPLVQKIQKQALASIPEHTFVDDGSVATYVRAFARYLSESLRPGFHVL